MRKYSKVFLKRGEKLFGFRYNYEECCLENVSRWDCKFDENNNLVEVTLPSWKVISSIGLSKENWSDSPEYWIEQYEMELNEEAACEARYI